MPNPAPSGTPPAAAPGVKPTTTPPPASVPPPGTQTPPANVAAGGRNQPANTPGPVPYERFAETNEGRKRAEQRALELEEDNQLLQRRLSAGPQAPTNGAPANGERPDATVDPLGALQWDQSQLNRKLDTLLQGHQRDEGTRFIAKIQSDFPVFADKKIGEAALEILRVRLDKEANITKTPAHIIREVAEQFTPLVVAASTATHDNAAAAAGQAGIVAPGTPGVGTVKEVFKPKTFDEASRAAKGAWSNLATRLGGALQV